MRSSVRHILVGIFCALAVLVPVQIPSTFALAREDIAKRVSQARTLPPSTQIFAVTPTALRREPCDTCPVIVTIPAGALMTANESEIPGWWSATYDGIKGYVARIHTALAADVPLANLHQPRTPVVSTTVDRSTAVFIKHIVNATRLNVRSGPGTDFAVLTMLAEGDEVRVTGEEFGWYRIVLGGETAFVRSQYVTQQITARNDFVEPIPARPLPCLNNKSPNPTACLRP
jgi:uncharacterized protein YgiM (DUF1202 family)